MPRRHSRGTKRQGRKSPRLFPKPLVLITCEGGVTEPCYFNGLRLYSKIPKERIIILSSGECGGTDPKTVVKCAKQKKREYEKEGLKYDEVWCVFDRDQHPNFDEAIRQARDNNFQVAFSNPCFELWCLLHFQDQSAHIERDNVRQELRKPANLPDYNKNMKELCNRLADKQGLALQRAESLRKFHEHNRSPETTNPSTSVDKLVKLLNEIKR